MITFPELSVDEMLARVAKFNELVGFGLTPEDFERLQATAPEWPLRPGCIRSLRLRKNPGNMISREESPEEFRKWYGRGYGHLAIEEIARLMGSTYENGVHTKYITHGNDGNTKQLFDRHVKMLHTTLSDRFFVTQYLLESTIDYAPVYGQGIYRPDAVEWVVIDLFAHLIGTNVAEKYGDKWIDHHRHACADELLAALWIHPEAFMLAVETLGNEAHWWATGYETSHDIPWGPAWSHLGVHFDCKTNRFFLSDSGHGFIPEIVL